MLTFISHLLVEVLGPGDLKSAETHDRRFGELEHPKKISVIPRTFWAWAGRPMGPMGPYTSV